MGKQWVLVGNRKWTTVFPDNSQCFVDPSIHVNLFSNCRSVRVSPNFPLCFHHNHYNHYRILSLEHTVNMLFWGFCWKDRVCSFFRIFFIKNICSKTHGEGRKIKLRGTKEGEDKAEKQKQQVSTNGQWHVSTVARLSTGARTAEIFTQLTERETHSLQISWSRERARELGHFSAFLYCTGVTAQAVQMDSTAWIMCMCDFLFYLFIFALACWTLAPVCLQAKV